MVSVSEAFSIAVSFHEANDLVNAAGVYRQILSVDPCNTSALNNISIIVDQDEAIQLYKAAVAFDPAYAEGYLRLGHYYKTLNLPSDAISCFDRVVRLKPDHIEALYNLAVVLHGCGYVDEAIAYYGGVLAAAPWHADALYNIGLAFQDRGRLDEAIVCFEQILRGQPDRPELILRLFALYQALGRIDEAVASLERLIALQPGSVDTHQRLIYLLQDHGRFEELETACRRILSSGPPALYFAALTMLGMQLEQNNRHDDAVAIYDDAIRLVPGHAFADTRRRLLLIRRSWGPPPAPAERRPGRRITMSGLGNNGRFGNQVIQYAFLRVYAHVHGLGWEAADWIGRDVFGLDDPYISEKLPVIQQRDMSYASVAGLSPELVADKDISGFYFFSALVYAPYKDFYQSIFAFSEPARRIVEPALAQLRQRGDTVVAIHVRRGDLRTGPFWIVPEAFYLEWLTELWPTLDKPVLFIATDEPEIAAAFSAFAPLTGADFPQPPPGVEFLVDYAVLIDADILATANSSFSYTAALLNKRARLFMRACETEPGLVAYDPWADPSDGAL